MKTTLTFFGNLENSRKGTIRGLIAFIFLGILITGSFTALYPCIYKSSVEKISGKNVHFFTLRRSLLYVTSLIIIASAIAVQLPKYGYEAFVYGALVGFVVYSITNIYLMYFNNKYGPITATIDTALGTVICAVTAILTYYISKYFKAY